MDNCVFCNVSKEKSEIIANNKLSFSLLSNPALSLGHILIIPKRHVEKISDLTGEELNEIFFELIHKQEIILKRFTGCDIRQNYRPFIKDNSYKVSHLHFHLIPREPEDDLYKKSMIFEKDVFRFLNKGELEDIKKEVFD